MSYLQQTCGQKRHSQHELYQVRIKAPKTLLSTLGGTRGSLQIICHGRIAQLNHKLQVVSQNPGSLARDKTTASSERRYLEKQSGTTSLDAPGECQRAQVPEDHFTSTLNFVLQVDSVHPPKSLARPRRRGLVSHENTLNKKRRRRRLIDRSSLLRAIVPHVVVVVVYSHSAHCAHLRQPPILLVVS